MRKIAFFCIPAHGHTNPMLPVAAELVKRGDAVRFYSFNEFKEKIISTGAEFISCDRFLPSLTEREAEGLKTVSSTELAVQDIRITLAMDGFLDEEFKAFGPDIVYTDSVCFWGKLNAWKHNVPMVVSTSTFAFNRISSQYMKNSPSELADMIFGLPRLTKELRKLEPYGYHVKNALSLIQSDNDADSVVYTSERFQPCAESFSDHYFFAGPSVFSKAEPKKDNARPLVYISMGTVINDRPDFYGKCIEALRGEDADVIISCGGAVDRDALGALPDNIKVYPYVDQLDVLSRANAFITHCGMNSVSESLYMAAPMVLYPQTSEQKAVARRAAELNTGIILEDDSAEGVRAAVRKLLDDPRYAQAAGECSREFRSCPGTEGAADFIESAPHVSNGVDVIKKLNGDSSKFTILYFAAAAVPAVLVGFLLGWKYAWIVGVPAGVLSYPIGQLFRKIRYKQIIAQMRK